MDLPVTIHRTAAAASHEHPPGSGHKAPLLSPKPEYSKMIFDRHIPLSQRATPKASTAPQNPHTDGVRAASADRRPDQTSRPPIPASALSLRHPGSSAERRRLLSRSPHGRAQCIQPRDAKDREPRDFLPCRSCGRYRATLYNTVRPHSSIGNLPPADYAKLSAPASQRDGPLRAIGGFAPRPVAAPS
jgi:hypothetical protein